jgi:acetate kinase
MNVLVVNAGGVTLDLTIVDDHGTVIAHRHADPWDGSDAEPITDVAALADVDAVGHRVVHGGTHTEPVVIDDDLVHDLEDAGDLAPVHQERSMLAIAVARDRFPDVPHVACFDTTFHRTIPEPAATYPLPRAWRERWPLRRVGFHGLSHAHVATTARAIVGTHPVPRLVSCHLGSGASVCAIRDGASVDTTMGMTPLEGVTMVTRSGTVDPGMLLWLLRDGRLTLDEVDEGLNRHAGLAGLAGGSGDMRDILRRRRAGDPDATLAFDVYVHRLRHGIASMAATLDGIDVLAFTGGVGQHLPEVRQATVDGLTHLGLHIDSERNARAVDDADVGSHGAAARCIVVATGEHHSIAIGTRTAVLRIGRSDRTTGGAVR